MLRFFLSVYLVIGFVFTLFAQFIEPLPGTINSKQNEYAPSVSADGQTIIYQSNKDGKYKLYMAKKTASGWESTPINSINNYRTSSLIAGSSLTSDGNFIYFFANFPGGAGKEDIWYVERTDDGWSEPINAGKGINSAGYEGFPSISSNGNRMYFMRSVASSPFKDKFCYQLFVSERGANGTWQTAKPLPAPINMGCENCPRILPDNETLLFASIRGDQVYPNYDLFMSRLQVDGSWTEPRPLDFINSSDDELYGAIPASGDVMYVNRKQGEQYDLYSLRVPPDYRPASAVTVQGSVIDPLDGKPVKAYITVRSQDHPTSTLSSNASDGSYTMVLQVGSTYEVSIDAPGYESIKEYLDYRSKSTYELINQDFELPKKHYKSVVNLIHKTSRQPIEAIININNQPLTRYVNNGYEVALTHGIPYTISIIKEGYESIIDLKTFKSTDFEKPLIINYDMTPLKPELRLEIVEKNEKIPLASSLFLLYDTKSKKVVYQGLLPDGTYTCDLEFDRLYLYKALAQNYFYTEGQIDLRNVEIGGPIPHKVELVPLRVGERLTLNSITFETGSAELSLDAKQILNNVINVLAQNRNLTIEIAAYTDNVGHAHTNHVLSEQRAQAVMDYFLSQQVPASMISAKGYGQHHPVASNSTEEGRALNRRVEFIVKAVN